jgi:hypothetical protein
MKSGVGIQHVHAIVFLHTLFCSVAESVANTNLYSHAFNPYPVSLMYQTVAFWYRHTPGATLDDIILVPRHTLGPRITLPRVQ